MSFTIPEVPTEVLYVNFFIYDCYYDYMIPPNLIESYITVHSHTVIEIMMIKSHPEYS